MPSPQSHTLEEHRDYLYNIVKLMLFYVHFHLENHPEETFQYVIRERVDIYRKTDANPGPLTPGELFFDEKPWLDMENAAFEIYQKCRNDRAAFEKEAFEVFRQSIDDRCERDYYDCSPQDRYQCGSLRYDIPAEGCDTVTFHIGNAKAPDSIFTDPRYLPECFFKLLDVAENILKAKYIRTGSWLNGNKHWLKYFPQEWVDNQQPENTNVKWHYGFWGQFISARHTFNAKYGNILRETGKMPFYPRTCKCSIAAMRKHLENYLQNLSD